MYCIYVDMSVLKLIYACCTMLVSIQSVVELICFHLSKRNNPISHDIQLILNTIAAKDSKALP